MGNYKSVLTPEIENFNAIVSSSERLNGPVASVPVMGVMDSSGNGQKDMHQFESAVMSSRPLSLEQLTEQVENLRASLELVKSQQKKELKQLMTELDEEKKIRLSLQMEVEHIKKVLSK